MEGVRQREGETGRGKERGREGTERGSEGERGKQRGRERE